METGGRPGCGLCAAVDVHYLAAGGARAAAVLAADAAFARVLGERTAVVAGVAPYRPGEFYLRELPPLRAVLDGVRGLGLLVVDGYADLDPAGRPGLGAHAHAEFGVPVIGVAKSRFRTATHAVPVVRGSSARPLYVTAAGMPAADAADLVRRMAGRYRLPDALRRADTLARAGQGATAYPSAVVIRRADPGDVDALRAIAAAAYQKYVTRIGRDPAPMTADYAEAVRDGQAWTATEDGRIVGFAILIPRPGYLLLENVAVLPAAQGRGIGGKLLSLAEEHARDLGLGEIRLYTNEAMTENLAYYARHGYTETHRARQDGFHRVFFRKPVD